MRTISFILLILTFLIGGCSGSVQTENEIKTEIGIEENKFNLEDVIAAIESQKLELVPTGITGYPMVLDNVIPEIYLYETTEVGKSNSELIYFYIYNSDKDRIKGVKEFNKLTERTPSTNMPFLYEEGNVFITYYVKSKDNNLTDSLIKTALEKLKI